MRDIGRIDKFCEELAFLWKKVPDWRFAQFISNIFGDIMAKYGDPFYFEEDKMLERMKEYFNER